MKKGILFFALAGAVFGQCALPTPVYNPAVPLGGLSQPMELHGFAQNQEQTPSCVICADVYGGAPLLDCHRQTLTRITDSGTFLGISPSGTDYLILETGLDAYQNPVVVAQWSMIATNLQIAGQQPLTDFNHEAIRLPNGNTAVIAHEDEVITSATQCPTAKFPANTCDILGDKIVVLDPVGNVTWIWDSFNPYQFPYLDRRAILGEDCTPRNNNGGCPVTPPSTIAQDWLHGNSLWFDPADGNLVINLRNQDWIVKVAYENGSGDGSIVWRLGNAGDFTMASTIKTSSPWEDHAHDVTSPAPGTYIMFDNGNGRHQAGTGKSRGLVYAIDEPDRIVEKVTVYSLGVFSPGSGSAQTLSNGDLMFLAGRPMDSVTQQVYSEEFEFVPGAKVPLWTEISTEQYRAIRLSGYFFF